MSINLEYIKARANEAAALVLTYGSDIQDVHPVSDLSTLSADVLALISEVERLTKLVEAYQDYTA